MLVMWLPEQGSNEVVLRMAIYECVSCAVGNAIETSQTGVEGVGLDSQLAAGIDRNKSVKDLEVPHWLVQTNIGTVFTKEVVAHPRDDRGPDIETVMEVLLLADHDQVCLRKDHRAWGQQPFLQCPRARVMHRCTSVVPDRVEKGGHDGTMLGLDRWLAGLQSWPRDAGQAPVSILTIDVEQRQVGRRNMLCIASICCRI